MSQGKDPREREREREREQSPVRFQRGRAVYGSRPPACRKNGSLGRMFHVVSLPYTFNVTAVAADNETEGEPVQKKQYTRPDAVRNLTVSKVTTSSVFLNWTEPQKEGLYYYRVQWATRQNETTKVEADCNTTRDNITEPAIQISHLTPGTQYTFRVTSLAADTKTEGQVVEKHQYTRPDAVRNLTVTEVTTSSVFLKWTEPQKEGLYYRVQWATRQNETAEEGWNTTNNFLTDPSFQINDLTPGTLYAFRVISVAQDKETEGQVVEERQYTKPERVSPAISIKGTNDTITVTWEAPPGKVEFYKVNLTSEDSPPKTLNSSAWSCSFSDLKPGKIYTAVVTTVSGPFAEDSEPVSNATYPNPPGAVQTVSQTTGSISISWDRPPNMETANYSFIISAQPHLTGENRTSNNSYILENLISGNPYNISVVTEGPMGYRSTAVTAQIYTKPLSVTNLQVQMIGTTNVSLTWDQPDPKDWYMYVVTVTHPNGTQGPPLKTSNTSAVIEDLTSGSNHTFTVSTEVPDGTISAGVSITLFT
ncbi:hypothetical protein JZ751_003702, partial [Albula glossodonta]